MKVDGLLRGQHRKAAERCGALRALLCAVLLFAPSSARPGYRCGRYANSGASAALDEQGRIHAWGNNKYGGSGAPTDTGFTAIFSTDRALSALDEQGAIHAWGDNKYGGSGAPGGTGFTAIFSTDRAFAALDEQGRIHVWGDSEDGGVAAGATAASFRPRRCVHE